MNLPANKPKQRSRFKFGALLIVAASLLVAMSVFVALLSASDDTSTINATRYDRYVRHEDFDKHAKYGDELPPGVDVTFVGGIDLMLSRMPAGYGELWQSIPYQIRRPFDEPYTPLMNEKLGSRAVKQALRDCYHADDLFATARRNNADLNMQYRVGSSCWSDNDDLLQSFKQGGFTFVWDGGLWINERFVWGLGPVERVLDANAYEQIAATSDLAELADEAASLFLTTFMTEKPERYYQTIHETKDSDSGEITLEIDLVLEKQFLEAPAGARRQPGYRLLVSTQKSSEGYTVDKVDFIELDNQVWKRFPSTYGW